MTDRLFDIEGIPEVPLLREPRARRDAAAGSARDARFLNDYPPEWDRCPTCEGRGMLPGTAVPAAEREKLGKTLVYMRAYEDQAGWHGWYAHAMHGQHFEVLLLDAPCPDCLGMGSIKARVRLEAGHRCVRCLHPYIPKGDARMLTAMKKAEIVAVFDPDGTNEALREALAAIDGAASSSGMHDCETCGGAGWTVEAEHDPSCNGDCTDCPVPVQVECDDCKGTGKRWTPWSACDERCIHGGPIRVRDSHWDEAVGDGWVEDTAKHIVRSPSLHLRDGYEVEAIWRILTVHHLDGDKANLRWWNLASLCQRCHLEIQAKVVMERVYPHEHSEWFKPYVAGYYAHVYLGEDLPRPEVEARMDELLALELS